MDGNCRDAHGGAALTRLSLNLPEFAIDSEILAPGAGIALSPDGRRIVYTGRGANGAFRLHTRALDQEQSTLIPGTEGAYGPFFSPDGQSVAFFAGGQLKKTSVEHGGIVVLSDAPSAFGGSWGDDGNIVADGGLSRVPSTGGAAQPITELRADARTQRRRSRPGGFAGLVAQCRSKRALPELRYSRPRRLG